MILWIIIALWIICVAARGILQQVQGRRIHDVSDGLCQTTGNREVQADAMGVTVTNAGKLAVLSDGIGKENTGKACAALAAEAFKEAFLLYKTVHNPAYFFERTMYGAHMKMQKLLEERQGGASVGAVLLTEGKLYYCMAGQVQVALVRGSELIPLSEGQTVAVLAQKAYRKGKLGRQETIWSQQDNKIWNYVGRDGFSQMEVYETPVHLKEGDLVVMMTKGIFEEVPAARLEQILTAKAMTAQEKADRVVAEANRPQKGTGRPKTEDRENGSIMVLLTDGAMG